ncbi:EamA family transporter [Sphingosinicellaceae bacterium]|nr:EamA family transporter [Sphingosinicellaceae bacterium]
MKRTHLLAILLIDLIWAGNIVAIKFAVEAIPPLMAVTLRYTIVLLCCAPWARWLPGRMPAIAGTGVVAGALFMGLGALSYSLADNVSALAIAGQVGVPFSLILAVIFYHERIHFIRITGILLAFAGVGVLAFDPRIFDERVGLLLTVAAALCWAIGNLLFRRLQGVFVLTIHFWLAAVSIPLLAAASLVFEPGALLNVAAVPLHTWGWLVYSAVGASLIGHGGMTWLFQRYPVSTVAPLTLPTPLLGVIVAVLVFGNAVTPIMVVGGLLTLAGIAIITLRTSQARDRTAPAREEQAA